jgi:ATP-dependent Clp protease ATP-binding subunit ClpA
MSVFFLQLYGARPIRRWLQKNVMTRLSEMLVKGEVDAGTTLGGQDSYRRLGPVKD